MQTQLVQILDPQATSSVPPCVMVSSSWWKARPVPCSRDHGIHVHFLHDSGGSFWACVIGEFHGCTLFEAVHPFLLWQLQLSRASWKLQFSRGRALCKISISIYIYMYMCVYVHIYIHI